jgi:surface polysaccharide O-acyltransferase-like enzyme
MSKPPNLKEVIMKERKYDLDWLRIIATLFIFLFHCARIFVTEDFEISNATSSLGMEVSVFLSNFWLIPLFFMIAGMGTFYALGIRKGGQYAKERFKRLMIPWIFGVFVLVLPITYYTTRSHGEPFVYLEGLGNLGYHLWFLLLLFVYSLIALPLFQYLRKEENRGKLAKMGAFFKKPGGLVLLALPFFLLELLFNGLIILDLDPGIPVHGGYFWPTYLVLFICGFLLVSDDEFQQAIDRYGIPAIVIAVISMIVCSVINYYVWPVARIGGLGLYLFYLTLHHFGAWFFIIAVLYLAKKYLNFNHKSLKTLNEMVLPFYILHMIVLIVIGYYVVSWNVAIIVKYLVISIVSFVIIVGLVLDIRQVNVFRFLFGMRRKKKPPRPGFAV